MTSTVINALNSHRANRSPIRPVSRVWFELTDTNAFDQCIARAVDWMSRPPEGSSQPRSGVNLPATAWDGVPFDVTDDLGANPAKAQRINASDGALWAARLDYPDPAYLRTWVSEFFAERHIGRAVRFGAQLTCVLRGDCPPFEITRPNVIRTVLKTLSAEADGRSLSDRIEVTQRGDISDLVDLLYNETRRLPVVVISESDNGSIEIRPDILARRVGGAAHIVCLTSEATRELYRKIGKRMSAFNGAVRLYQPGLTEENEDPFSHPLWLQGALGESILVRQIAGRVLPAAFLQDGADDTFPRYAFVRDIAARRAVAERSTRTVEDRALAEIELLKVITDERTEERDTWQSLAQEEEAKRIAAEADIERLKSELARLESKAKTLEYRIQQQQSDIQGQNPAPDRGLESYNDLEDWADDVLGDAVIIHEAALKDCRKNGHENTLGRVEAALLIMRDHMTPWRRTNDSQHRDAAKQKLIELGFEDSFCFVDRDEAKRWPEYSVKYNGESRILYDHLKYGNGYDNANQIRIYYFWDKDKQCHVVGKMPSHLSNHRTS